MSVGKGNLQLFLTKSECLEHRTSNVELVGDASPPRSINRDQQLSLGPVGSDGERGQRQWAVGSGRNIAFGGTPHAGADSNRRCDVALSNPHLGYEVWRRESCTELSAHDCAPSPASNRVI